MRRLLFALFAFAISLGAAPPARAATLQLIELHCRVPQEKDANGDELRLEISPDTGSRVTLRQNNMKKGTTWSLNKTIPFHKSAQLRLTELDTHKDGINFRDEDLGRIGVTSAVSPPGRDDFPAIQYATFKGNGAHYVLSYKVVANPGRAFEVVSLRCVTTQEKDNDGDELRLRIRADGGSEITLPKNGVKAGSVWNVGRKLAFFDKVTLRLIEHDGFGIHFRDEDLGTRVVTTPTIGTGTVEFTGHGARYILTYRMTVR